MFWAIWAAAITFLGILIVGGIVLVIAAREGTDKVLDAVTEVPDEEPSYTSGKQGRKVNERRSESA